MKHFLEKIKKTMKDLKLRCKNLKEEHSSFRDPADKMIVEKDKEISRLIDMADDNDNYNTGTYKQDTSSISNSAAEQQILILARQQAQREEELAQSPRHILALQKEIEDLERENRLHSPRESMLKVELHNMERTQKREGVDMTYLKNVFLKLLETGMYKQDASSISNSAAEQQILILARQKAQREEELAQSQRHILALQEEIEELERENRLHSQQESMLKAELRNMERMQKREGVDMTYLKNVILKLLETGEVEALLPVVAMLQL
ncbi:protein GRIP-like isoform X2 [Prunus avium]|uniref:Protein GRIP-like isoform X2 n=1 Tax=Prunus avium TaxID=42229 RepID=A0A6P5SAT6_PRUAV|nr:protein GRIP-like isoform X2 [Prunus avium]